MSKKLLSLNNKNTMAAAVSDVDLVGQMAALDIDKKHWKERLISELMEIHKQSDNIDAITTEINRLISIKYGGSVSESYYEHLLDDTNKEIKRFIRRLSIIAPKDEPRLKKPCIETLKRPCIDTSLYEPSYQRYAVEITWKQRLYSELIEKYRLYNDIQKITQEINQLILAETDSPPSDKGFESIKDRMIQILDSKYKK
jgi:hypothetical protein